MNIELDYVPQTRQRLLHSTAARQILYGGAAGGGKSHCIRWDAIGVCLNNPGCDAFLFRRTTKNLEKNHINPLKRELPSELGSFNETRKVWNFPNGSILHFCYCENDADLENYYGAEFHWLGIDEAGQFSQFQLVFLRSRVRLGGFTPKEPQVLPRIVLSANPGGKSHDFLKRCFIDIAPADSPIPPFTSKIIEFGPKGQVKSTTTYSDGTVDVQQERYRVVGNTLIINKPGYIINATYRIQGNQMTVDC